MYSKTHPEYDDGPHFEVEDMSHQNEIQENISASGS